MTHFVRGEVVIGVPLSRRANRSLPENYRILYTKVRCKTSYLPSVESQHKDIITYSV